MANKIIRSEEYKEKQRLSHLGKKLTPETKKKLRLALLGKKGIPQTEAAKQKMRLSKLGKKLPARTKEWSENISNSRKSFFKQGGLAPMEGKKHSETTKLKMRESTLGQKHTEKTKQKCRERMIAHPNRKFEDTDIELKMQALLDSLGIKYVKQYVVPKITRVDFYIPEKNLIIECDGCYWHCCSICGFSDYKNRRNKDITHTEKLQGMGYKVVRFWGHEIKNMSILNI